VLAWRKGDLLLGKVLDLVADYVDSSGEGGKGKWASRSAMFEVQLHLPVR
jgi:hypothetical protein